MNVYPDTEREPVFWLLRIGWEGIPITDFYGDPDTIRTCDPQLRRLLLYPLSYGAKFKCETIDANSNSALINFRKYKIV